MIVNIATGGGTTGETDSEDERERGGGERTDDGDERSAGDDEQSGGDESALVTDGGTEQRVGLPESLTDPASLATRPDVATGTETFTHDEVDHCEAGAGGRAILGVTTDAGELLLWVHENGHAVLPSVVVEQDGDWVRAAREDLADKMGIAVELDSVERVRTVDHELDRDGADDADDADGADGAEDGGAGDGRHLETTHHVVFSASPARPAGERSTPEINTCENVWTAGWHDHNPIDAEEFPEGSVLADIRLFLE